MVTKGDRSALGYLTTSRRLLCSESQSRSVVSLWSIQSVEFSRPEYWKPFPSPGDLPNPGTEPRSPALQADSLPAEPQGKPKNTGKGSLSLLQWIFPTQELNWGLLHCRQILYQLSYQCSEVPCKTPYSSQSNSTFLSGIILALRNPKPSLK